MFDQEYWKFNFRWPNQLVIVCVVSLSPLRRGLFVSSREVWVLVEVEWLLLLKGGAKVLLRCPWTLVSNSIIIFLIIIIIILWSTVDILYFIKGGRYILSIVFFIAISPLLIELSAVVGSCTLSVILFDLDRIVPLFWRYIIGSTMIFKIIFLVVWVIDLVWILASPLVLTSA